MSKQQHQRKLKAAGGFVENDAKVWPARWEQKRIQMRATLTGLVRERAVPQSLLASSGRHAFRTATDRRRRNAGGEAAGPRGGDRDEAFAGRGGERMGCSAASPGPTHAPGQLSLGSAALCTCSVRGSRWRCRPSFAGAGPVTRPGGSLAPFQRRGRGADGQEFGPLRLPPPFLMDPPVKAGPLLLQQPPGLRIGAKRWKKSWFVLYPASPHGVARLEFFDCKEGAAAAAADRVSTKRLDKKILRLADCVSVAPAPDCSPKDGLSAFRLETSERTYLFAAEPQETAEWVAKLCKAAFLQSSPGQVAQPETEHGEERALEMATNAIYYSREEVSTFWVTVQKTEAAEHCQLHGTYALMASRDRLVLGDPHSKQPLYTWPYRLLRRYGRDKVMFSFEAGRRCESGPGNFTFETKQGNEIFQVVEAAIRVQKAQAEENRQSSSSLDSEAAAAAAATGLAQVQSAIASTLSLESEGPALESWGPRAALPAKLSFAVEEKKEAAVSPPKGQQSLRDPLARWPSTPSEDTGNVYSEPLDAVKGSWPRPDPLYADPVDSRRAGEDGGQEGWLTGGSLVYEQVGPLGASDCWGLQAGSRVHIYDEPEGRALPAPAPLPAAIYDEACLPCEAWRTQGLESTAGRLPAGDCAVPATPQKPGRKPPKPCPAPKPPRTHRKAPLPGAPLAPPVPGQAVLQNSRSAGDEPLYSRVLKLSGDPAGPAGQEASVDESRPASVYEDLGEI